MLSVLINLLTGQQIQRALAFDFENSNPIADGRDEDLHGIPPATNTALTLAACAISGSQAETVRLRVERGANVKARDRDGDSSFLLVTSIRYYNEDADNSEMVRLLLAYSGDARVANRKGQTALSVAKQSGQVGAVNLLQASLAQPR